MAKKKILVISSEEEISQNIVKILGQKNFSITTANNGQLGLEVIRQELPQLVICQLSTSEINGYKVLTDLRQHSQTATIPFILLTPAFNIQQWRKGMSLGADDFLVQSFTASELHETINTQFAKQEALVTKYQQELDYLRSSILGFLPHEMRTALTGILASSNLLLSDLEELDVSTVRDILYCIDLSSKRLSHLVHNFLLYSELNLISQNQEQIKSLRCEESGSCSATVEQIVTKLGKSHGRQADLIWSVEDASVAISSFHLAKLVEELIDNALKFSDRGTPISITGNIDSNYLSLSICDRGRGMTAQQIALIGACIQFERPTYEQQGVGLGLAIVKQLMQIYGGKLAINSILNQETKVTVDLPLVKSYPCFLTKSQPVESSKLIPIRNIYLQCRKRTPD